MRRMFLVVIAALALAAVPAEAGHDEKGSWEFGAFAGYGLLDRYDVVRPGDGPLYGARFGYFFTPHLSLDASWQTLHSETNYPGSITTLEFDFDIDSTRLNLLWNFLPRRMFNPFVTVGVGHEKFDIEHVLDSRDPGINAGGGVRWYFSEHVGLRFDARYVYFKIGRPSAEYQANYEGTLGIVCSLGGRQ